MEIKLIDPINAEDLIKELDEYQSKLYPPDSCHLDSIETLRDENSYFYGAIENEEIVAIGSVKIFSDYGELKRIYVPPKQRKKGLAVKIINKLETLLISKNKFVIKCFLCCTCGFSFFVFLFSTTGKSFFKEFRLRRTFEGRV